MSNLSFESADFERLSSNLGTNVFPRFEKVVCKRLIYADHSPFINIAFDYPWAQLLFN